MNKFRIMAVPSRRWPKWFSKPSLMRKASSNSSNSTHSSFFALTSPRFNKSELRVRYSCFSKWLSEVIIQARSKMIKMINHRSQLTVTRLQLLQDKLLWSWRPNKRLGCNSKYSNCRIRLEYSKKFKRQLMHRLRLPLRCSNSSQSLRECLNLSSFKKQ